MTKFEQLIPIILEHEGGYVNDPDDPGGETRYGISKRAHPDVDIKTLTYIGAVLIYRRDYWREWMEKLPPRTALLVFDCGVNCGIMRSIRFLQSALLVPVDGDVGPQTLEAINKANWDVVTPAFARMVYTHYITGQEKYRLGWLKRLVDNLTIPLGG